MPRRGFAPTVQAIPGAVYSPFAQRLPRSGIPPVPLHVGDTWLPACVGARMQDLTAEDHPDLHRYAPTAGVPALLDALVEKLRVRNGIACERDEVLVGAGATGVLANAVGAIAAPGEEVLILAPFWPLIRGIVQAFRATPVEVPFFDRVHSADDAVAAVGERITQRSVALYVSTPSNPTGRILPRPWLEALAELAAAHDLWLIADEVYEDYVYEGEHFSVATAAPDRTLSVFSFSKAYGMAGHRVGYLAGPASLVHEAHKVGTHTAYHAPVAGQLVGLSALAVGADWIAKARASYREVGFESAATLGLAPPQGSTFHFIDVAERLDERGMHGFLEDCFEDGVLVAPGASSGSDYQSWIRLCYTAAPPDDVRVATRRLARRIGAGLPNDR
ncbi:MAG: pyridoxal phosphate-dependent aminotransferase [Myxococcota bacterium]|nr:pyridoxal phosphate-dependent aminotransferase [Myxococcota bacterium]